MKRVGVWCLSLLLVISIGIGTGTAWAAQAGQAFCSQVQGVLYKNDFEQGNKTGWEMDKWNINSEDGRKAISASNHQMAFYTPSSSWSDYTLDFDFKLTGSGHFCFRFNQGESGLRRYFLALHPEGFTLNKQVNQEFKELLPGENNIEQKTWHHMTVKAESNRFQVLVDSKLLLDYTDRETPIYTGGIAFESLDDSSLAIDNVSVTGAYMVQKSPWKKTGGPLGGLGYDVRISPAGKNIMFVTDNPSGVNKSTNGGQTWFQANNGITTRSGSSADEIPIFSLTIDPNNPNIVWTGTQSARGIFKSTDCGVTWTKMDNGIAENNEITFRGFAVKPGDSNIVFAGAEIDKGLFGKEFARQKGKIYKTVDGGKTWKAVWEGGSLARIIIFDPVNPDILYASTGIFDREAYNMSGEGVIKSTDGGNTWHNINQGLENLFVGFLEMNPQDHNTLICAAGNNTYLAGDGVYITHNGGQSWQKILSGELWESFTVATFSPSQPSVIYAGSPVAFYRSDNGGKTWQKFNKALEHEYGPPGVRAGFPISAVVDPDNPMVLFVNNYGGGVFKSIDGAKTWLESSTGYTGANLHQVIVSPVDANKVYAIGRSGPYTSSNAGQKWAGLCYYPLRGDSEWNDISVCPGNPQLLLCSDEFTGLMFRSTDAGNTWKQVFKRTWSGINTPAARHGFKVIEFAPSNGKVVYAGMRKERISIDSNNYKGPSFGMYKSVDAGVTWKEINSGLENADKNINCVAVNPAKENLVYIGTYRDGIFRSVDGGAHWQAASNGLMSEDVRSLAIDPKKPNIIYAGLGNGVGLYKSEDGGNSWGATSQGITLECPSYLQRIGQVNPGVSLEKPVRTVGSDYTSTPWTLISSVVVLPSDPNVVFVADYHRGVYMSSNQGQNWVPINDGLDFKAVTSLALSKNETMLYASTSGGGVYRLSF